MSSGLCIFSNIRGGGGPLVLINSILSITKLLPTLLPQAINNIKHIVAMSHKHLKLNWCLEGIWPIAVHLNTAA